MNCITVNIHVQTIVDFEYQKLKETWTILITTNQIILEQLLTQFNLKRKDSLHGLFGNRMYIKKYLNKLKKKNLLLKNQMFSRYFRTHVFNMIRKTPLHFTQNWYKKNGQE